MPAKPAKPIASAPAVEWCERPYVPADGRLDLQSFSGTALTKDVLARRDTGALSVDMLAYPSLSMIDDPWLLPDAKIACHRVADAIDSGERIAIETDYDVDGSTSHAILRFALIRCLGARPDRVKGFVGNRLTEGYGLSQPVAERIAEWGADLVITADNGSGDEPRIRWLAQRGISTVVTDHHRIESCGPPSAYAVVNPARADSRYPDNLIAGCAVVFLFMNMVRRVLMTRHREKRYPSLSGLLDFVALGTVADCVSLGASANNRALVRAGLALINRRQRPCWSVTLKALAVPMANAETLGFQIGPRINARTRLSDPMAAIDYLTADSETEATHWFHVLDQENEDRKAIQQAMLERSTTACDAVIDQHPCRHTMVYFDAEGHPGVNGICASRMVERYGRASVYLSWKRDGSGCWTGSCRGVPGYDIYAILQRISLDHPRMLAAWGGHEGAGGLTLSVHTHPEMFSAAFEQAAKLASPDVDSTPGPVVWHDGHVLVSDMGLDAVSALESLAPWGRGFEYPAFVVGGAAAGIRAIGADKSHVKFCLKSAGYSIDVVWFRALHPGQDVTDVLQEGMVVQTLGSPHLNRFRGKTSVQLIVSNLRTGNVGQSHSNLHWC